MVLTIFIVLLGLSPQGFKQVFSPLYIKVGKDEKREYKLRHSYQINFLDEGQCPKKESCDVILK